jgi:hypothetical protein
MPTGLTDALDKDPKITTQRWVTEQLVRMFGLCAELRDYSFSMSEKQIEDAISDYSDIQYHSDKYGEARDKSILYATYTPEQWDKDYEDYEKKITNENVACVKRCSVMKARHDAVRVDLTKLFKAARSKHTKAVAKFGLDQLDLVESETRPYIVRILSKDDFVKSQKQSVRSDLKYHKEQMEKARKRVASSIKMYKAICNETHRILG